MHEADDEKSGRTDCGVHRAMKKGSEQGLRPREWNQGAGYRGVKHRRKRIQGAQLVQLGMRRALHRYIETVHDQTPHCTVFARASHNQHIRATDATLQRLRLPLLSLADVGMFEAPLHVFVAACQLKSRGKPTY